MQKTKTLIETPLFQTTENLLTPEECQSLIKFSEPNLKNSLIINGVSGKKELSFYRNSNDYFLPDDHELTKLIYNKVSNTLGIDQLRFEKVDIIRYMEGESFNTHSDYFNSKADRENFRNGGQRVATALIYLNEPESGGETFFPRVRLIEKAKTGKMLYFQYNYCDEVNEKTVHKGMSVEQGEKWVATVWIRQYLKTQIVDDVEFKDLPTISDIEYELECGKNDSRTLRLRLPGNQLSENTIIVSVSADLRSAVLLYLLSALNSYQHIPYFILPITIGNHTKKDIDLISNMLTRIRERTSSGVILDLETHNHSNSLLEVFLNKSTDKFYKYAYIFSNSTADLLGLEEFIINPFSNLDQHHIDSAAEELGILDLFDQDK
jgi:hypothetical protein